MTQFLAGRGGDAVITQPMIDHLNAVLTAFRNTGSAELRAAINAERAQFNGLQDFVGRTFADWGQMLEWSAPTAPFIHLSNPRRNVDRFSVEANRVPGLDYQLQRTPSLTAPFWERVSNAELRLGEFVLELSDPGATNRSSIYRLQAAPRP